MRYFALIAALTCVTTSVANKREHEPGHNTHGVRDGMRGGRRASHSGFEAMAPTALSLTATLRLPPPVEKASCVPLGAPDR